MPDAKPAKLHPTGRAVPERRAAVATGQKIVLRDLIVDSWVGVTSQERARSQRLCVNLELELAPSRPSHDRIDDVVSYSNFCRQVRAVCTQDATTALLETLAGRIADACLEDPQIVTVRVRLEKLDRYPDMAGVGIEMVYVRGPS